VTGLVTVDSPDGTGTSSAAFVVVGAPPTVPRVDDFSPREGVTGTAITIKGSGFANATFVALNNHGGQFTIVDDSTITFLIPHFADTGPVTVQTYGGYATTKDVFRVGQPAAPVPIVTEFSPASGRVGTSVLLTGTGLARATSITFGGAKTSEVTIVSDTQLLVIVPTGAKTGLIEVTTPGGKASKAKSFKVQK